MKNSQQNLKFSQGFLSILAIILSATSAFAIVDKEWSYIQNSEIDRIYAPGSNFLQKKSFETASAYGQEVYIVVVDNCTSPNTATKPLISCWNQRFRGCLFS